MVLSGARTIARSPKRIADERPTPIRPAGSDQRAQSGASPLDTHVPRFLGAKASDPNQPLLRALAPPSARRVSPVSGDDIRGPGASDTMPSGGPVAVESSLGAMIIVPDDFAAELPKGAVRASVHRRMVEIFDRIVSGQSQLTFDTSNLAVAAEALAFKQQYTEYLRDLIRTAPGLELLAALDASRYKTTIARASTFRNETRAADASKTTFLADGTANQGCDAKVLVNPGLKSYVQTGQSELPWMTERARFGFYHELVHAYHDGRGDAAPGAKDRIAILEFQALGLGPFRSLPLSDNAIRAAMGKSERPDYGGYVY